MSEQKDPSVGGVQVAPMTGSADAPRRPTAGALLRAAREAQGLHIAALAAAIKVTPRKLDALEGDRLDELPDATFARALAQTICRHLKMDPQPVLALLPANRAMSLAPAPRLQPTPYRDRAAPAEPGPTKSLGLLFWCTALLLVGAAVVYFMPVDWFKLESTAPVAPAPAVVVSSLPLVAPGASVAAAVAPAAPPSAAAETVFSAPLSTPDAAPAANGALVITTTDASWVEVRDAKGQTLLSETVQPGRSIGVDGALPFRLLIGNASVTRLVFKGQAVDVMARARENVARFELQ